MITGFVDPSFGVNVLRGGGVTYLNQGFGQDGNANDDGHPTILPSSSTWAFKVVYFCNLAQKGVGVWRGYGHDYQAEQVLINAGADKVSAEILETLDAAALFGIKCIVTLGGLSDKKTCAQGYALLDKTSAENKAFKSFMAKVADAIGGHPALKCLEALNEADYLACIAGAKDTGTEAFWLKHFPAGGMQLLIGFSDWQVDLLDGVRAEQKHPGKCPLGNGTAMDSSLYCDANGNPCMPWNTDLCISTIIPLMAAGCDVWTPHLYQHEKTAIALQVLANDKLPSFIKAAAKAGKELILGEAGGLYAGGIWTAELQAVYDRYPGLTVCWMIRSWDPKVYTRPAIPVRVPYSPAPVETPVETPAPVADPVPEPSTNDSSSAQDPPDEPEVPVDQPSESQEPAEETPESSGTTSDTTEEQTPAGEAPSEPDPPEADDPARGADEGTSNPQEAVPQDPAEPSPETGSPSSGTKKSVLQLVVDVLVLVAGKVLELLGKIKFKRK